MAAIFGACASSGGGSDGPLIYEDEGSSANSILASWSESFSTIEELTAGADAVVVGSVIGDDSNTQGEAPSRENPQTPRTVFTIEVDEVTVGEVEDVVSLIQLGGRFDGAVWEISDDPLMVVGETYLLFMRRDPESGNYYTLGPWGRFVVHDGSVCALSYVYPNRDISDLRFDGFTGEVKERFDGTPLDEVLDEVRAAP